MSREWLSTTVCVSAVASSQAAETCQDMSIELKKIAYRSGIIRSNERYQHHHIIPKETCPYCYQKVEGDEKPFSVLSAQSIGYPVGHDFEDAGSFQCDNHVCKREK